MQMNDKYFVCCEQCFENIGKRSTNAARLWMDLCAVECEYGLINFKSMDNPCIRTLEHLGFLITTDKLKYISIRLKGRMETTSGEPFFCSREGFHE